MHPFFKHVKGERSSNTDRVKYSKSKETRDRESKVYEKAKRNEHLPWPQTAD